MKGKVHQRTRRQRILIGIGIGVGALVVAFGVFVAVINIQEQRLYTQQDEQQSSSPLDVEPYVDGATAAVQEYFDALTRGDAQAALAMMQELPVDTTFLTDEALAGATPTFDNVQVERQAGLEDTMVLTVTFNIAGQKGTLYLNATNQNPPSPEGPWLLTGGTVDVDVNLIMQRHPELGLVVNGIPVPPGVSTITLFPGIYPVSVADTRFTFPATDATLVVPATSLPYFDYDLSEAGQLQIADAVQAKLDTCLTYTVAVPPADCGFSIENPTGMFGPIEIAAITWSLGTSTTDRVFQYNVAPGTMAAKGYGHITIQANIIATNGMAYVGNDYITSITVDLTDPTNLVVTLD